MTSRVYLFLMTLLTLSCNGQNSVLTNEIFSTKENLFGVKSMEGKLLIDSIYTEIKFVYDHQKLILPPNEDRPPPSQLEYYLVRDPSDQKALFNNDGELVFGFIDCLSIIHDKHTQTIVISMEMSGITQARSFLYNIDGELLFDSSCKHIAFIDDSDLIALIVEENPNEELYLYNPFTKKILGPFDHFNIYNKASRAPIGMAEADFEKYKLLNAIAVRREIDGDYIWGMVDSKGKEILPLEYKNLRKVTESEKKHPAFKHAMKPEGVEFLFFGSLMTTPPKLIYFDSNFEPYEFKILSIEKSMYQIEKM